MPQLGLGVGEVEAEALAELDGEVVGVGVVDGQVVGLGDAGALGTMPVTGTSVVHGLVDGDGWP